LIFVNRLMTYDPFHAIEKGEFKLVPNPGSIILTYEFFMYRCLLIYIFVGSALIAVFSKPENRLKLFLALFAFVSLIWLCSVVSQILIFKSIVKKIRQPKLVE
jgi:hypothetical protein